MCTVHLFVKNIVYTYWLYISAPVLGGNQLSHVNLLYIIIGVVIFVLLAVLITICLCIRCTGRKPNKNRKRSSMASNRKPSSPSEAHIPSDPEIICHDRLSKTPMLPTSQSTGSSSFNPYDHHSIDPNNRYSAQLLTQYDPQSYEPSLSHHGGYDTNAPSSYNDHQSTLSSKYSYTSPRYNDPITPRYNVDAVSSSYYRPNPYGDIHLDRQHYNGKDMDSCLTSL